ncbi:MAG: universal stress protein [Alphaproteobacteria bacterium]|nr:universal stress protein [Alphaproteobacteria bacterium]
MYHRVLVPIVLDHDKVGAALKVAEAIADPDAEITLFHVREKIPRYVSAQIPADVIKSAKEQLGSDLAEVARAGREGTKLVVVEGHPSTMILDYVEKNDIDCIVIYSHEPGVEHFLLGSTASNVVRSAGCSVHVIR